MFLGIIFFLELTTGVLAFVFKDWIKDQLNLFINNNIRAYRDDIDLQNLIDFTQEYVSHGIPSKCDEAWLWHTSTLVFFLQIVQQSLHRRLSGMKHKSLKNLYGPGAKLFMYCVFDSNCTVIQLNLRCQVVIGNG